MLLSVYVDKIKEIWKIHEGAVLFCDTVPILRFHKNELDDKKMLVVLENMIQPGHEYWFDYYD